MTFTNLTSTNLTSTNLTPPNLTSTNLTSTNLTPPNLTSPNLTSPPQADPPQADPKLTATATPVPPSAAGPVTPASSVWATVRVSLLLLLITFCSTTAVGMRYMHNFRLGLAPVTDDSDILPYAWVWQHIGLFADGLPFSLTLILILLAHEFGHYFACRAYRVRCSLPYMLPAPTLSGTFGAVIRLKSRVRSRAALLTIGAAGPVAGFVVAIVTSFIGVRYSSSAAAPVIGSVQSPLLIAIASAVLEAMGRLTPMQAHHLVPHPVLTASWIGCLITALNLVPAGQLDGGHIMYALSPRAHQVASRVTTVVLLLCGIFFWFGWLLWAAVLLAPRMRHPRQDDTTRLTGWQIMLALTCLLAMILTVTYQPFHGYALLDILPRLSRHMHL